MTLDEEAKGRGSYRRKRKIKPRDVTVDRKRRSTQCGRNILWVDWMFNRLVPVPVCRLESHQTSSFSKERNQSSRAERIPLGVWTCPVPDTLEFFVKHV
jgi:hypothetical protein